MITNSKMKSEQCKKNGGQIQNVVHKKNENKDSLSNIRQNNENEDGKSDKELQQYIQFQKQLYCVSSVYIPYKSDAQQIRKIIFVKT